MSREKRRKERPEMPRWYWIESDDCYGCENRSNCSNCHLLKEKLAPIKERRYIKEKKETDNYE